MIDAADLAGLPPAEDGPARPPRRRPPDYLAAGERRRLLWRVMPAALAMLLVLTWVERAWFPREASSPAPPVDTRLETVRGPRPAPAELVLEPDPAPPDASGDGLGVPAAALAAVRDDTLFRGTDLDAWQRTFALLRATGQPALARAAAPRVSFSELFGQPRRFRGRLVRLRGTFHRLERLEAPANDAGIEAYWQGWLEPAGGPATPVIVQCLALPEGMATGMRIDEPVDVVGAFLKRQAYAASDTVRVAPLVLALEPARLPPPVEVAGSGAIGTWVIASIAALVAATLLGARLAGRRTDRPVAAPSVDLATVLAGHEPLPTEDALGRLGADHAAARHAPEGGRG